MIQRALASKGLVAYVLACATRITLYFRWPFQAEYVEFRPKDVKWHKPLVILLAQRTLLIGFEEAWKRQLPEMPFPVRVESDDDRYTFRLYYRQSSGQWKEETESPLILGPAQELKQLIEEQANG